MKNVIAKSKPTQKRPFFYSLKQGVISLIKKRNRTKEKKSVQWIPRDLVKSLKKQHPHGHTEYMVQKGIPHVKFPLWVFPLLLRKGRKRIEVSICLHPDPQIETAYLAIGSFPFEKQDGAILLELQGGVMNGILHNENYENVLAHWLGKRKVNPEYTFAISIVWREIDKLINSGDYILERCISQDKIALLPDFSEEVLGKFIYTPELPIPEPVVNPAPTPAPKKYEGVWY